MMNFINKIVILCFLLLHCHLGSAQLPQQLCPLIEPPSAFFPSIKYQYPGALRPDQSEALESGIASFISTVSIPQYAVSLVHGDKTIFTSGQADTPFRIGSITKVFTALGALILREKGLLSLDDPVKKFLPHFSIINPYGPDEITLRELMGHLSGMPRELCPGLVGPSCPHDESDILKSVAKMELVRPPWSREPIYSNLGFGLLGRAWEKVAPSKSWERFVMEEIVRPLGLNSTGVDLTNITLAPTIAPGPNLGWLSPAGQMYSTAKDLAKFVSFLLTASPPLITAASIREWTRASTVFPDRLSGFALPWELQSVNFTNEFLIGKGGAVGNFLSQIMFHPPTQTGIAILLGLNDTSSAVDIAAFSAHLLGALIAVVEASDAEIVDAHYIGRYACERTPPVFSGALNATLQVLSGTVEVTSSPSLGLSANINLTLTENGLPLLQQGPRAMLLKNATENSFWVSADGSSCFIYFALLGAVPSLESPNRPGSVYADVIEFDFHEKTLTWPYAGAVCVKQ